MLADANRPGPDMSLLQLQSVGTYLAFDEAQCRAAGKVLASAYRTASPFPHIAIDDFVPAERLRAVVAGFPSHEGQDFYDRDQERLKYQYHPTECRSSLIRNIFAELNSQAFLGFLEEMTGIEGLVPDPYFTGGGLHETRCGGHLGIHADFNLHHKMKLERRLNLLVYLNEGWADAFGGELELWDRKMERAQVRVAPVLGRAVVFTTTLDSYHGHPDPLACPPDVTRRSIATYYYTALEAGVQSVPDRMTNFQVRPGSADQTDRSVRLGHLVRDWVPPAIRRGFRRLRSRS